MKSSDLPCGAPGAQWGQARRQQPFQPLLFWPSLRPTVLLAHLITCQRPTATRAATTAPCSPSRRRKRLLRGGTGTRHGLLPTRWATCLETASSRRRRLDSGSLLAELLRACEIPSQWQQRPLRSAQSSARQGAIEATGVAAIVPLARPTPRPAMGSTAPRPSGGTYSDGTRARARLYHR